MRRSVLIAALLFLVSTLPVCAQRHGGSSVRGGVAVGARPGGRVIVNGGVRPGWGVRGGIGFRHNSGVFFNSRGFRHRRFGYPFAYGYPYYSIYPYTAYPYYDVGLQSDFVYSDAAQYAPSYMAEHDTGLQNDLYRLQAELDQIKQEQASQNQRQQYALNTPTGTPRPLPAARPEPPPPPTVLVFRDGHRSEIHNYAVTGQTLWIFSEERARKVPLTQLDLDATRSANEERGVEFAVQPPAPAR